MKQFLKKNQYKINKTIENNMFYINHGNLIHNYKLIQKLCNNSKIIGVVKGNAYGHGMVECTKSLSKAGCNDFYVANIDDALVLRKKFQKIQIYVLSGPITINDVKTLQDNKIVIIVNNFEQLNLVNNFCNSTNKRINVVLKLDTGMNRLGFKIEDFYKIKPLSKNINLKFLMSHFTSADAMDVKSCNLQLKKLLISNKILNAKLSIANSSGCFLRKKYHLDFVRPGKSLYGMNPFYKKTYKLKQVASFYSPIIQTSFVKKGDTVGYEKTFKAKKNLKTATINIGYANGILRKASNRIVTYINDFPAKALGRISMDLITIDISKVPEKFIRLGQPVEILGKNATYEQISNAMETNEHEALISIGSKNEKTHI